MFGELKINMKNKNQKKKLLFTLPVASLGSFGNPLTEFESIERNI